MRRSLRLAFLAFALLVLNPILHAAPPAAAGAITGAVRDADTAVALDRASVQVVGGNAQVVTDADGWFVLADLALGSHVLEVRRAGYQTVSLTVTITPGEPAVAQVRLLPAPVPLAQVVVTPSRFGVAEEMAAPNATLTNADLETLPQLGEDLYRTIARLPGLVADDFTAAFWVRGAPNSQLLARLDGVELIEPFHLKDIDGALSIVDLSTINRLDLTTGGFTAEYGDRLAGVLAMETESGGGRPGPHTSLGISLTGVDGSNRGTFADGRGSWLITGRRGYPDIALKVEGKADEVFPRYYDASAKVEYKLGASHTLSLHALHAYDTLRYDESGDPELRSSYGSDYVWTRWQGSFGERLTGEAVLSFAELTWRRHSNGYFDQTYLLNLRDERRLDTLGLRQDWTLILGDRALVRAGADVRSDTAQYAYIMAHDVSVVRNGVLGVTRQTANVFLHPDTSRFGAYVAPRFQPWTRLTFEPSVRFDRQSLTSDADWSPRFNASYALGHATTLRAAWGLYYQSQGLQELDVPDGSTAFHRAERAEHRVLGLDHRLRSGITLRAEAYERLSTRLRPHWDNLNYLYNLFPEMQSDRVELVPSSGTARGVEIMAQRRTSGPFEWAASYAYARATERVAGRDVPVARDQRHTVYLDGTYSPNPRWRFSASWQYHTGWPTTDVSYAYVPLNNGKRTLVRYDGVPYGVRLPAYHRLDLRATRRFQLRHSTLRAFIDVFNAYDRENLLGYTYTAVSQGSQVVAQKSSKPLLPILPSAGVNWEF